jgi:hypothetical protein
MTEIHELTFNNFNHEKYYQLYPDLSQLNTKDKLWKHWHKHGKKEKRQICIINHHTDISKFENNFVIYITRHVNNEKTNNYWIHNVLQIRKFYKNIKIIIIDDNSNNDYLNEHDSIIEKDKNISVIQSEYHGRGELLPYIYFLKNTLEKKYALFLHDSMFINKPFHHIIPLNFDIIPLWTFPSHCCFPKFYMNILNTIKNLNHSNNLIDTFNKLNSWNGFFGSMSLISHRFLLEMQNKFNITNLIPYITTRRERMLFERIIGILSYDMIGVNNHSLMGSIHRWSFNQTDKKKRFHITWDEYINDVYRKDDTYIFKVWSGR